MSTAVEEPKKRKSPTTVKDAKKPKNARENMLSDMFNFGKVEPKNMNNMKDAIDMSGSGGVIGTTPTIKALFGSVIKASKGGKRYVYMYPYDIAPGPNGEIATDITSGLRSIEVPGRDQSGGLKWSEASEVVVEMPLGVGFATNVDPKSVCSPGTPIVLFGANANVTDRGTFINVQYARRDENTSFDDVMKSVMSRTTKMESFVNEKISFAVVPQSKIASCDWQSKIQAGMISVPMCKSGGLDKNGNPDVSFNTSLKVMQATGPNESSATVFSSVNIFKHAFSKAFSIMTPSIMEAIGCSILARANMVFDGELKSLDEKNDEEDIGNGVFYIKNIVCSLRDTVTDIGFPVSSNFVKKHLTSGERNDDMTMNRDIVLLNECTNYANVSSFYKLDNYKYYALCNVDVPDESSSSSPEFYDSVLNKHSNDKTVFALYAVKDAIKA